MTMAMTRINDNDGNNDDKDRDGYSKRETTKARASNTYPRQCQHTEAESQIGPATSALVHFSSNVVRYTLSQLTSHTLDSNSTT